MTWNLTVFQSVSALLSHFYNREGGCLFSSLPTTIPNPVGDFQHFKGTKGNQKPVGELYAKFILCKCVTSIHSKQETIYLSGICTGLDRLS